MFYLLVRKANNCNRTSIDLYYAIINNNRISMSLSSLHRFGRIRTDKHPYVKMKLIVVLYHFIGDTYANIRV